MRIPLCQWTMEKRPPEEFAYCTPSKIEEKWEETVDLTKCDYDIIDINAFINECKIDLEPINTAASTTTTTNTTTTSTTITSALTSKMDVGELNDAELQHFLFPSPNCEHCGTDQSMCWHKLWSNYQIRILLNVRTIF